MYKETELDFEAILDRIQEGTGAKSQADLATILEVRRGTISDAKRRNSIPSDWLIKLCRSHNLNPIWLLDGVGSKFISQTENGDNKVTNKDLRGTCLPGEDFNNLIEYVKYLVFFIETIEK
ncbi:helix-turn-helix domain-containing protein, partial [Candidatus Pacearchaeota archaeon]|nr:helix-turn-helix domain-containing protein [Candidatus Pacearchaeota archaeon]